MVLCSTNKYVWNAGSVTLPPDACHWPSILAAYTARDISYACSGNPITPEEKPPMKRSIAVRRAMILGVFLCACVSCSRTVEVQVIAYSWVHQRLPSRSADCNATVYREADQVPAGCSDVADVFVGDNGQSTDCGLDRMLDEVRAQACLYGADAAQVIRTEPPSVFGSTCYELRARFLKCSAST
jgi:hypothetical protein